MLDVTEIRLGRALGRAIEAELQKGAQLPEEIITAYNELLKYWQWQMTRELS